MDRERRMGMKIRITETEPQGFLATVKDLLSKENLEWSSILIAALVSALISLVSLVVPNEDLFALFNNLIGVFSDLLGFMVATIAIIYSFNSRTIGQLSKELSNRTIPYHFIISTFTIVSIWLLICIVSLLVFTNLRNSPCVAIKIFACVGIFESLMAFLGILHTILHLFAIRTFLVPIVVDMEKKRKKSHN